MGPRVTYQRGNPMARYPVAINIQPISAEREPYDNEIISTPSPSTIAKLPVRMSNDANHIGRCLGEW